MTAVSHLTALRRRLESEEAVEVPLRELLEWFGAKRRGVKVVDRIRTAMAEAGLRIGDALVDADSDDVLRFRLDTDAEVVRAAPDEYERLAGIPALRESDRTGASPAASPQASPPAGDLVAHLLGVERDPSAADRLVAEVDGAPEWIEVTADCRGTDALVISADGTTMTWPRFEAATASVYDWDGRGPLWYSSPVTLRSGSAIAVGAVVFCRDGWWAPDWTPSAEPLSYAFRPWDQWAGHRLEQERDGAGVEMSVVVLLGGREEVRLSHGAARPPWSAVSIAFADAVLRRVIPVVCRDLGKESLGHPPIGAWDPERADGILGAVSAAPNAVVTTDQQVFDASLDASLFNKGAIT
ncbi:MAG: hypothetical protein FJ361_06020 [Gemmatimonadetes bacterium]|nr:hypothetical protein [Gemmatimonadota bacterium]